MTVTGLSVELSLGGSGAAVQSATAPITGRRVAGVPSSSQLLLVLLGAFPEQLSVPFLNIPCLLQAIAVPY